MSWKIAVVEDETDIRDLMVEELLDEGYDVVSAANGVEGLEVVKEHKPNLVLCDITMPDMDGYEMLGELRKELPKYADMPIVFVSALADRKNVIKGKELGVDDYLTKPVDFELMLATVKAQLREVERMTDKKEREMIKLYNALRADSTKSLPALIVCDEWTDFDPVQKALQQMGLNSITQQRGSKLGEYIVETPPSLLILGFQTNDLTAKLTILKFGSLHDIDVPTVLVIPDKKCHVDDELRSQFDLIVQLPASAKQIAAQFQQLNL